VRPFERAARFAARRPGNASIILKVAEDENGAVPRFFGNRNPIAILISAQRLLGHVPLAAPGDQRKTSHGNSAVRSSVNRAATPARCLDSIVFTSRRLHNADLGDET
jgi:hypothetical protein